MLSQVYVPDPASVGQHLHDVAAEMVSRGYRVRVLTSARGYDSPEVRYAPREVVDGVEIRRLPLASFGKKSLAVRVLGQLSFLLQVTLLGLFSRRLDGILVSTSPPMCGAAAWLIATLRRAPLTYWVMDINPDQAVALGAVRPGSLAVRLFNVLNRMVLRRAAAVVTLDRFMASRVLRKHDVSDKLSVFPPWPHDDQLEVVAHEENPFRRAHGLDGKFVVMYSGNHTPTNPISTAIEAAAALEHRGDIVFAFVGGGLAKREVRQAIARGATNILDLPYQPMSRLNHLLSAADAHLVSIGNGSVGIVHPCKVYGAMAVARPILFLGPRPSHVSELMNDHDVGFQIRHGDVAGMARAVTALADAPEVRRAAMGRRARSIVESELGKNTLCRRFGDVVERALGRVPQPARVYEPIPDDVSRKKAA